MIDLSHLTSDSTLGHLPLNDFQVERSSPAYEVADRFEKEPALIGVIVTDYSQVNQLNILGTISRQRFLEEMGRIYGRDLYLHKPIDVLFSVVGVAPLILPDRCKIQDAANQALNRVSDLVFEPVVVVFRDRSLRLLDTHLLLLAQSHMLALVNQTVQQQKLDLQKYLSKLRQEQTKAKETNKLLELQQLSIQDRNQLLEQQKAELLQQSQEITELNQRFVQIGQVLSHEGKKAFQATIDGVDAISRNTDDVIEIGKALAGELETVRGASSLIRDVSRSVQFLVWKARKLADQLGSEFDFVGRFATDIGDLNKQVFEANKRLDETAIHLKTRIGDLTKIAKDGATEAQTLLQKFAKTELVLAELDTLIRQQGWGTSDVSEMSVADSSDLQTLMQRIEKAGLALSELEQLSNHGDAALLISKIERRLKYSRPGSR